ncbi:MAG: choice-of-anchor E domain-containing protein [Phycisphaerales bacterium]
MHRPQTAPSLLLATACLCVIAVSGSAHARGFGPPEPIVLTSDFQEWERGNGSVTLTLDHFDTLGGTRELVGVSVFFDAIVDMTVGVENLGDVSVDSSEYSFSFELTNQSNWSIPFAPGVLGGGSAPTPSVNLGPSDGVAGSGPDFHEYMFGLKDLDILNFFDVLESDWSAFIGSGQFTVDVTPLVSFPSSPPPPFLNFDTVWHQQAIEIGIQYTYAEVPAPGAVFLAALAPAAMIRRKR